MSEFIKDQKISIDELRKMLLTVDGCGKKIKEEVLDELIKRARWPLVKTISELHEQERERLIEAKHRAFERDLYDY